MSAEEVGLCLIRTKYIQYIMYEIHEMQETVTT